MPRCHPCAVLRDSRAAVSPCTPGQPCRGVGQPCRDVAPGLRDSRATASPLCCGTAVPRCGTAVPRCHPCAALRGSRAAAHGPSIAPCGRRGAESGSPLGFKKLLHPPAGSNIPKCLPAAVFATITRPAKSNLGCRPSRLERRLSPSHSCPPLQEPAWLLCPATTTQTFM